MVTVLQWILYECHLCVRYKWRLPHGGTLHNFHVLSCVQIFPFSSKRKRMSVVARKDGQLYLHSKGASEIILGMCDKVSRPSAHTTDVFCGRCHTRDSDCTPPPTRAFRY
jgi:magnesium-transporting ATPase (P-type)